METIFERVAGLDVHKAELTACVRLPTSGDGREQQLRTFPTTVRGLVTLRDWLETQRVTHVAMEATGVYWQPVWHLLEDAFELTLCNARHVKQVPGRKTDVADAAWLCQLMEAGLLRGSFVPPRAIRDLRDLTRYRKVLTQERTREVQRLHKVLQDAGLKLASVAADILGVSGRAMLEALLAGTTDAAVWPSWRGAGCARSSPPCARRCTGASGPTTPSWSARCWRGWTGWTRAWRA